MSNKTALYSFAVTKFAPRASTRRDPVRFARPTRHDISGKGAIVGTFTSTRTISSYYE